MYLPLYLAPIFLIPRATPGFWRESPVQVMTPEVFDVTVEQTISTADDDVELTGEEQQLLDQASGKVLLFQLAGPMIFGVAKAIAREHNAIGNCQAVVFDLSEVSHLGVTAAIALENAVKEAVEVGREVFLVGATGSTEKRLRKMKLMERLPERNIGEDRLLALRYAVDGLSVNG